MKDIVIYIHPTPNKKSQKRPQKKRKKRKEQACERIIGNLDDSTGQTPSVILSGMNYLTRSSSSSSLSSSI
jgi:hypothetical protein